jgi:hypothetical protein
MDDRSVHFSTYVEEDPESGACRVVCVIGTFDDADMARDFAAWFVDGLDGSDDATVH